MTEAVPPVDRAVPVTRVGDAPMPTSYDHRAVEARWSAEWERAGLFHADPHRDRPRFSVVLPPPSVSAHLHMGHALQTIVQDVYARYRRMTGFEVLWLPGLDHAMIATQRAIERDLAREGLTKERLGRAAFAERVERWNESVGSAIVDELRELGASLDLPRLRFTMDAASERSVRTAFVRLWDAGLIYQDLRIINWCPTCTSVLSDGQLRRDEGETEVVSLRVPLVEQHIELAVPVTRPELLPAVVAIVVDPDRVAVGPDERAVLPLTGEVVPVVPDGDACRRLRAETVPLTPGHDLRHWEVARQHGLPVRVTLDADGRVEAPGLVWLDGQPAGEARGLVTRELESRGQVAGRADRRVVAMRCERCAGVVEQMASRQWFVSMERLAARARSELDQAGPRFHPARYTNDYRKWLDGLRDWCISRQLWLGPHIPVFSCECGHRLAAVDEPRSCPNCGGAGLRQETDVLDTWFSQAIWQASALGWPDGDAELMAFHPTSLTVASRDILPLGISKMIMVGLELTDVLPFHDVVITCVVLAPDGRKMDTAKGTAIPPGDIVAAQGADALRGWAVTAATKGQDIQFDPGLVTAWRRTVVKLWNATRLVTAARPATTAAARLAPSAAGQPAALADASHPDDDLLDRWIRSRLHRLVTATTAGIEAYELHRSAQALTDFIRGDFCGRYLEAAKTRLHAGDPRARSTAVTVLDAVLRLLHPFLPFVTEELWHQLPGARPMLERCPWPDAADFPVDPAAEQALGRRR